MVQTIPVQNFTPLLYTILECARVHFKCPPLPLSVLTSASGSPIRKINGEVSVTDLMWLSNSFCFVLHIESCFGTTGCNEFQWHSPLLAGQSLCFPHFSEHCWLWSSLLLHNWKIWGVQALSRSLLAFK